MGLETELLTVQELLELAKKVPLWEKEKGREEWEQIYRGEAEGITFLLTDIKMGARNIGYKYILSANYGDISLGRAWDDLDDLTQGIQGPIQNFYSEVESLYEQRRKEAINRARELLKD